MRVIALAAAGALVLSGCGDVPAVTDAVAGEEAVTTSPPTSHPSPTATSSPTPTPTPSPEAFHDFTAIEGVWEGIATEGATGAVEIRLVASVRAGGSSNDIVGEAFWFSPVSASEPDCRVSWLVVNASPPAYDVREIAGPGCVSGTVELVHDPDTETLRYTFIPLDGNRAFGARGALERSDQ